MNHTKQRVRSLLSLFLVLLTIFGVLPINVLADAGISEGNWKTNLQNVASVGATLTDTEQGMQITRGTANDAWAMGSVQKVKNFTLETDVTFVSGNVVNLIIGAATQTANNPSRVFKFDRTKFNETKLFNYGLGWETLASSTENSFTTGEDSYHLKLEVTDDKIIAYVGNAAIFQTSIPSDYTGGYVGVGVAEEGSTAIFQNTYIKSTKWNKNLGTVSALDATLTETAEGLHVEKSGTKTDAWAMSAVQKDKNFSLETDVTFESGNVVNLIFGAAATTAQNPSFVYKFDRSNRKETKIFHFGGNWAESGNASTSNYELNKNSYKLKLEVSDTTFTASVDQTVVFTASIPTDYTGGYIGVGVADNSVAVFQNTMLYDTTPDNPVDFVLGQLTAVGTVTVNDETSVTVSKTNWNNHVVSEQLVRNFTLESDIEFVEGADAGFILGCKKAEEAGSSGWIGAKVNKTSDGYQLRVFREGYTNELDTRETLPADVAEEISKSNTFHLKLCVAGDTISVYVNNSTEPTVQVKYFAYPIGYIGFSTCGCTAKYSNVSFTRDTEFHTNLKNVGGKTGVWSTVNGGFGGDNSTGTSDVFALFDETAAADKAWIFEGDMHLENSRANGGLVFGYNDGVWYGANIDRYWYQKGKASLHRAGTNAKSDGKDLNSEQYAQKDFNLRVVYDGKGNFQYSLDGAPTAVFRDTDFKGGQLGLSALGANVTFNNVYYHEIPSAGAIQLINLVLEGAKLDEEFSIGKDYYLATAETGATSVTFKPYVEEGIKLFVNGKRVNSGDTVELTLRNDGCYGYSTATITTGDENGYFTKTVTLAVLKPAPDEQTLRTIGNRPQFHFTAPYGFINDPNGMLYNAATGEYHFFYQAYPYITDYGPKHWGHAVTKDLATFEGKPIALFPDENGEMWSGSGFIDYNNTAGLYPDKSDPASRMVLVYYAWKNSGTNAGLAYTEDGGETWIKAQNSRLLSFDVAPGHIDPKVLWLEKYQTWVMFTAGGNIYTSDDLWTWKFNSRDVSLECPDMFEIKVEGTKETKWVRNVGGTFYIVGDIVKDETTGAIKFQEECSGPYNGDSLNNTNRTYPGWIAGTNGVVYAAQHYKDAPGGRIISVSWLRENYSKRLDPTNTWTGTMTVAMEQKLYQKTDGSYILYSYPAEELKSLRGKRLYTGENVVVTPYSANILADKEVTLADIDGSFTLDESVTEFGFKLRTGSDNGYIAIKYDVKTQMLTADYTHSGDDYYKETRTMPMSLPTDRTVTMRVLLDNIVVESFGNEGEAAISSLYYRNAEYQGMEFYTVGGNTTINSLSIYEMTPSWVARETVDMTALNEAISEAEAAKEEGHCKASWRALQTALAAAKDAANAENPSRTEVANATTALKNALANLANHTWKEVWSSDETNHWHDCAAEGCTEKTAEANHEPDRDEPTEDDAVKCTVCDRTLQAELGHRHTLHLTLVPAVKATCKAEGNIAYYRCTCGKLFKDETATTEITAAETVESKNPNNHDGGTEVRNAKDATYTEEGYTGDTHCLGCGAMLAEGKVIPKLKKPSSGGSVKLPVSPNAGVGKKPEDEKKELPFTDVPQTAWYYESVQNAWAAGLIDGVTATKFKPDDTLTVAQAIKLAAALYQMEHEGEVTLRNGSVNWYDSYVSYAVANGIIEKDYASYTAAQMNAAITRAEFVHIFHGAESTYKAINQVADDAIPDVKTGDAFTSEIYEFYRAGILTGSDAKGTFHPASSIKRSEVATILLRMFETSARKSISLS